MNVDEYLREDGVGLATLIANGEVSASEVTRAAIEQIEKENSSINAVTMKNYDADLSAAKFGASPLYGVPFLLKDVNLYSFDMPTTFGSTYFRQASPRADSEMVSRWRTAGLTIIGKTNTPEFAADFVTEPKAYGVTRNPADHGVTVGGSSGGAAAAVASGMVPIAHATDLGGSIRIPASCCGVFGFKPTAGLNPVGPYFSEIASGLNSDHVVTRSVRDSAASLDITAEGKDRGDYLSALARPPGKLRVGVSTVSPSGHQAGKNQVEAVRQVALALEDAGHTIVEYRYPSVMSSGDWFDLLWIYDIVKLVEDHAREIGRLPLDDDLEPLTWHLLKKARQAGTKERSKMLVGRQAYIDHHLSSFGDLDVLLTPTLSADPAPVGALSFNSFLDVESWNEAGYRFAPFSTPANICGQPAASCPTFRTTEGLPVGVQIVGKPGQDTLLLQLAAQIEQIVGWK
ncbi:amidase [Paraburkholderia silviterrae]|uniref:Amidase n=1 Tax=Paraburkholderia silviterrae TaxID=2528715 RepID=A0A4R5M059_9BURK|nr:amidase [Paraburkholderia silviterrae]TDG18333.1 amidase [Paraburkholderia silviterrae]